jgi:hypothetical protein
MTTMQEFRCEVSGQCVSPRVTDFHQKTLFQIWQFERICEPNQATLDVRLIRLRKTLTFVTNVC